MKRTLIVLCVLVAVYALFPLFTAAETVSNGSVTMFTIGEELLGIMLHADKKIMVYQINSRNVMLKSVRTWHYDGQYAQTLRTLKMDGTFPTKGSQVDPSANPTDLYKKLFKVQEYPFSTKYEIPGLAEKKGGSGGGDLAVMLEQSATNGLLVLLDAENTALVIYEIDKQKIQFKVCRSILMEAQIPLVYPARSQVSPIEIRADLRKIEKKLAPGRDGIPEGTVEFKMDELPFVKKALQDND